MISLLPFHRPKEKAMAEVPVEVKKATPAPTNASDVWQSFRSEMDRLFDRFGRGFGLPSLRRMLDIEPAWRSSFSFSAPAIDMSEDETGYKISAELPGLEPTDLDVSVTGDMLVLRGEKRQEKEEKDRNYHFSERAYGSFQRAFQLPASVDRNKIGADFSKGVLTITLPKTREAQKPAKKIEVRSS
jgi:HSP20 family protein